MARPRSLKHRLLGTPDTDDDMVGGSHLFSPQSQLLGGWRTAPPHPLTALGTVDSLLQACCAGRPSQLMNVLLKPA
eukprot:3400890-Pyramimonas_sp.AAC.1